MAAMPRRRAVKRDERRNLMRIPPALLKRIRRVALRRGLTLVDALRWMIEGKETRMGPVTAMAELASYLEQYQEELEEMIGEDGGDVACIARAIDALSDLESDWPAEDDDEEEAAGGEEEDEPAGEEQDQP